MSNLVKYVFLMRNLQRYFQESSSNATFLKLSFSMFELMILANRILSISLVNVTLSKIKFLISMRLTKSVNDSKPHERFSERRLFWKNGTRKLEAGGDKDSREDARLLETTLPSLAPLFGIDNGWALGECRDVCCCCGACGEAGGVFELPFNLAKAENKDFLTGLEGVAGVCAGGAEWDEDLSLRDFDLLMPVLEEDVAVVDGGGAVFLVEGWCGAEVIAGCLTNKEST
ncbi:hypothetical protein WICPIJ_002757 [Wickerhamomyces pijperi]|uniref:Uncharacterized protein n=1 Tax=Wickerhamomyces pijperi TaxID=599730 RepID=A0A9P8QB42_WICPI|nr:hypothetical protein WICPIJ_002757 [Wickerhamomyces pijperi]